MPVHKIKDLTVITGSYTDSSGQSKNRYRNVGSVMRNEDGSNFLLLDRAFNPAGVPFKQGSDQIIINIFDLRDDAQTARPARAAAPAAATHGNGDDVPF